MANYHVKSDTILRLSVIFLGSIQLYFILRLRLHLNDSKMKLCAWLDGVCLFLYCPNYIHKKLSVINHFYKTAFNLINLFVLYPLLSCHHRPILLEEFQTFPNSVVYLFSIHQTLINHCHANTDSVRRIYPLGAR